MYLLDKLREKTKANADSPAKMLAPQRLNRTISTPNLFTANANAEIVKSRGFKPSDRKDPQKREFLVNLSKRIWHMVNIKSPHLECTHIDDNDTRTML